MAADRRRAPFKGKQQVVELLTGLLTNVDSFNMKQLIGDNEDYVAVFTIEVGRHMVDGMDHMHLNQDGLVDSMTVAWRPLSALVEVQKKLASAIGIAALTLVHLKRASVMRSRREQDQGHRTERNAIK